MIEGGIDIGPLLKASRSFQESLTQVTSDLTRDGAIQRFKYTFELCWKTMRRLLRAKGADVNFPKDVFREAAADHLINDPQAWFGFLEKRHKTTQIYKEEVAKEVFDELSKFNKALQEFLGALAKR
jgi:nucleotidyltransferase substrate binding protein (TIGR01987 family)